MFKIKTLIAVEKEVYSDGKKTWKEVIWGTDNSLSQDGDGNYMEVHFVIITEL